MGLWGSLFGDRPQPLPERIDEIGSPFRVDAETREVAAAAEQGDATKLVAALRRAGASWDDRFFLLRAFAQKGPVDELLAQAEQGQPLLNLAAGARLVEVAWDVRGHGTGETVTKNRWESVEMVVADAVKQLRRACELDPADPTPYPFLIELHKVVSDRKEAARCFEAARTPAPFFYAVHEQYGATLAEKWSGEPDALLAFARETSTHAPAKSELHALVAQAFIERWLMLFGFQDDRAAAAALVNTPAVREEVTAAARRSVLADGYSMQRWSHSAHDIFAFWFYLTGEKELLCSVLQRLRGRCGKTPWGYLGKSEKVYRRALVKAGLAQPDPPAPPAAK